MNIEIPMNFVWAIWTMLAIWGLHGWVDLYLRFKMWRSERNIKIYDEAMKLMEDEGYTITKKETE